MSGQDAGVGGEIYVKTLEWGGRDPLLPAMQTACGGTLADWYYSRGKG